MLHGFRPASDQSRIFFLSDAVIYYLLNTQLVLSSFSHLDNWIYVYPLNPLFGFILHSALLLASYYSVFIELGYWTFSVSMFDKFLLCQAHSLNLFQPYDQEYHPFIINSLQTMTLPLLLQLYHYAFHRYLKLAQQTNYWGTYCIYWYLIFIWISFFWISGGYI